VKLREIFRFELAYQIRRPWPWLAFAILVVFSYQNTRVGILPVTLPQDFILNSPFIIAAVSVFSCLIWLLVASAIPGESAARDVQTGMHPLVYTMPVSKAEYLGGRFLAAFALNSLILLGVQVGSLLAVYLPGVNPDIIGPFRPAAYLSAYGLIALPNAFIATTIQFALALFSGRAMVSYAGSVILVFFTVPVPMIVYLALGKPALSKLLDPIGLIAIMNEMMAEWTLVEKNVRMFTLDGSMLTNRLLWLGISVVILAVMYLRFRFRHRTVIELRSLLPRRFVARSAPPSVVTHKPDSIAVPAVRQSFGFATQLRQTLAIAGSSWRMVVTSWPGLFLLVAFPILLTLVVLLETQWWGVPLLPRTSYLLVKHLTGALTAPNNYWLIVPLFTIYFAGELVWRERDAGLAENVDATPVPDWVPFLGKFIGFGLFLATFLTMVALVGIAVQVIRGYYEFQVARYVQILLGLQLTDYLLFAALAFVVQAVVNQKYVALLVTLLVYFFMIFSSYLGVDHNLLVYAKGPAWTFTDIRGISWSLAPWLWFKLYWAAWALLLAVLARLLWARGKESGFGMRMRIARVRLSRRTVGVAVMAAALVLTLGGFIFYNTNVLNEFITDDELVEYRAEYERRYGKYEGKPQPQLSATRLHVDIQPGRRAATIRGTYRLVNRHATPIDAVHLEPAFYVETNMSFDRPARLITADEQLGHFIYALEQPLQPGDALTLNFDVQFRPGGFRNTGIGNSRGAGIGIVENGTYLTSGALPVIGYQPMRELWSAEDRRKRGLPRQVTLPPPGDIDPHSASVPAAAFEAIVSTDADQVAVAPGQLRRTWSEGGRRYFHYVSNVPINGEELIFSADYTVHRERWKHVDIQVYLHPGHAEHIERLLRSVRASLEYFSAQFGTYPYPFLQIVEQPGNFLGMGVDGSGVVTGGEGFFLLNPQREGFDMIFEVVAHELGHQWWGMQLKPAFAEGGGVISESLAWYSAMQLVKHTKGREALRRLMSFMRQPNPWPPMRTGLPLLRAMDPWANYRRGPYAMHALSEYVGEDRVNTALRTLVQKHASSFATTLDMYHELQAVTPDSLKPLLTDLFEKNTYWTFNTRKATAQQTRSGTWQVTFEIDAKKIVADSAGRETEVPIGEMIEIGIFAPATAGEVLGTPLYLQKHRIRSGRQSITMSVAQKPARGGIDPYSLLDWEEGDNIEQIVIPAADDNPPRPRARGTDSSGR
jgi:ABC-2 type transport system permease protein